TLANQIAQPVRFVEQVQAMWQAGARTFVEVGPGTVLTNLVGKCLAGQEHSAVSLDAKGRNGIRSLWMGLAQLAAAGVPMNFEELWSQYRVGDDPRTREQPKMTLKINGSNYGRPQRSDEPLPRSTLLETSPSSGNPLNGHTTESESKLTQSESIAPVAHVNGAAPAVTPAASVPAVFNGHGNSNGNGAHGAMAAASTFAASSPVPAIGADVMAQMVTAVGTLQHAVDNLHSLLQNLTSQATVVAPPAASPVVPNGRPAMPAAPVVPPATNGRSAMPAAPVVPVAPVGTNGHVAVPVPAAPAAPVAPVAVAVAGSAELVAQMLDVVADKTGYPVEMLDLSMALEADLGIDSIKRVEILSAVQERIPALPEVETATMAALATLQEITDYLQSLITPTATNGTPPMPAPPPPTPAAAHGTPAGDRLPFELAGAATARYAVHAVSAPASGMGMPGLHGGANVEIVATQDAVADALAEVLRRYGINATVVAEPGADAEAVIHLAGLRRTATRTDTLAVNRTVFADAQRIAAKFQERGGVFITVQDTGGTFGLLTEPGARAWAGGVGALAKTAAQEWPTAQVKAIDIVLGQQSPITVAEHLAHEILAGGAELEVGLGTTHGRVTVVADARPVKTHTRRIDHRDVIVVSGGARGVTAASVTALAQETQASFVLIGRTELSEEPAAAHGLTTGAELKRALLAGAAAQGVKLTPKQLEQQVQRILADREVRATLTALIEAGSHVRYAAADVRDAVQLGALLDGVRADLGPITGLVHGAGVLADAPLHKKTLDGFDRVFETKVGGLCALLDATANDALKLVCLFSSVAARSGNVGQSDYAMANEILNKVALAEQARRGPSCLVRALGWGPWDSGMVTPGLKAMFESRGISLIPIADGARAFVSDVLDAETGSSEVTLGDGVWAGVPTHPMPAEGRIASVVAHATQQPYLLDHRIQGNVVLPVVQALEWFVRMAEACRPGQHVERLLDLKVLRGATLHAFDQQGDPMLVRCAPVADSPDRLTCNLSDGSGSTAYYSATVEMRSGSAIVPTLATAALGGRLLDRDACYSSDALFHGPAFQVLDSVDCQESSATATLYGLTTAGWPGDGWATDPAALDGCLQAALAWSFVQLGRTVLPLKVGEVVRYQAGALGGGLRCV
ncbi:MAG TPA: SDR family NAD(P)-dependent oxidoreductase, partial [Mycobacterium sp.]